MAYRPLNLKNDFRIEGNRVYIKLINRKGLEKEAIIDFDDFEKVINSGLHWHLKYEDDNNEWYAAASERYVDENGKKCGRVVHLHQLIIGGCDCVDHKNHDTLDNRKENIRVSTRANNSANRKGANKNNKTGVRNVHKIWRYNKYMYIVQIMKNGISYKKEFELDQLKEAKEYAEIKRKELFGEYAGKG